MPWHAGCTVSPAMTNELHRSYDDVLPPPLEPRAMMPAQWFTQRERRNAQSSIRRLMYAILEDAVTTVAKWILSDIPCPPTDLEAIGPRLDIVGFDDAG